MIWAFGIVMYTVLSILYFLAHMGDKYRKGKWYDYPILLPALAIAIVIGTIHKIIGWFK